MNIGNWRLEEDKSVRAAVCKITPRIAVELLKRNTNNRRVREGLVDRLASEMLSGEWVPISNGIGIDTNGILVDGQHRLLACVQANKDVWMMVVDGLPAMAMEKSDRGAVKSLPDNLKRAGVCDNGHSVQIASYMVRRDYKLRGAPCGKDVKDYIKLYRESLDVVEDITKPKPHKGKFYCVGFCAAIVEAHQKHGERALKFARSVMTDIGHLDERDPAVRLRAAMLDGLGNRTRSYQDVTYKKTCYAFNAWIQGKKIPCVREEDCILSPSELKLMKTMAHAGQAAQ